MTKKPIADDILDQLGVGIIVPLTQKQWQGMKKHFSVVDTVETGMSGQILLLRRPQPGKKALGWAFVEQPEEGKRVLRPFKNEKEARALIADRLAAYERMWDG